jgi:branched-chain amino acid transport system ATP-binding protein
MPLLRIGAARRDEREVPAGSPVIAARSMSIGYGRIPVVRGLTFEVHPGEVVCLLGANGAGKSTTLLGLAGELPALEGTVEWLGRPTHSPLHIRAREGLAYVPEERSIIRGLTVLENLKIGRGSVDAALEYAPALASLLKRPAGLLSGGEQQMLTLARALAAEPRLLLADELSLGLAPLMVERLLTAIKEAASRGVAVLLVEQHVQSALKVADRAFVLRRGRISMSGEARDLMGRIDEIEASYLAEDPEDPEDPEETSLHGA